MDEVQEFEAGTEGACELRGRFCSGAGEYTTDPFALEIHEEIHWMFMCTECFGERRDEI